jgi:2-polyprenyl-3-methyl-5-hydroxy-6-metoxy-1,4-benzoquinol methylase
MVIIKKIIYKIMSYTPYTIIKSSINNGYVDPLSHNTPNGMDKLFSKSHFLKKYNNLQRNNLYNNIIKLIPDSNLDVVDFGCGPGYFLKYVIVGRPTNSYYGYEYSNEAIAIATQECPEAKIYQHDIRHKLQNTNKYDIAICSQTLEHVLYPEKALNNILNSIKSGGRIILTVPDGRVDRYIGHINFWSEQSWKAWLEVNVSSSLRSDMIFDRLKNETGVDFLIAIIELN